MNKLIQKIKKKDVVFTGILFISFAILVYLFPYSGDDWAWGSQLGLDRLNSGFKDYNGRYGGNLLVMAITRSELLNMVVAGASFVCVCLLPKLFAGAKRFLPYTVGTLLFLLVPQPIFVQSVVWTAGFSNYVPPILLIFVYFILVQNIFEDQPPTYSPTVAILSALIGFISALFMENVTLYGVAISALILAFVFVRFRKVYLAHILHFIGSVGGAVLMFSNSAYGLIAKGNDGYRNIAAGAELKTMMTKHISTIFQQFFLNNLIVLGIFTLLCAICYFLYVRQTVNGKYKAVGFVTLLVHVFSGLLLYGKRQYPDWSFFVGSEKSSSYTPWLFALIAAVYFVTAFFMIVFCVSDKKVKFRVLLLLVSIPVLIAPLVVVDPIGPRCFFPPYFLLCATCVVLVAYLQKQFSLSAVKQRALSAIAIAGSAAMLLLFFGIYSTIHTYDCKRNAYIQKQVEADYTEVTVCELPYPSYVWCCDPYEGIWEERYKMFYDIDQDIKFKLVSYNEFNAWAEKFDSVLSNK